MKHRLRRGLAAGAVLASTLVAGAVNAPVAQATTGIYYGPDGYERGTSIVDTTENYDEWIYAASYPLGGYADCEAAGEQTIGLSPWSYAPGATVQMCVITSVRVADDVFYQTGTFTQTKMTIHTLDGADLSGTGSSYTLTPGNAAIHRTGDSGDWYDTYYSSPISIRLDADPLNGSNDATRIGTFEPVLEVSVDRWGTWGASTQDYVADSRGGVSPSNAANSAYDKGYIDASNGLMAGEDAASVSESALETDENATGKDVPVTRVFKPSWDKPQAVVGTFASNNRIVMWSNKPYFTPSTGHSVWYDIANGTKDSGTGNLDDQITTLANYATASGAPGQAVLIFGHEPHDNTTDPVSQGGKACTGLSTPSTSKCFGSFAEFRAAFAHVKARINALGKQNIVKLAYTAVDSNAAAQGNDGVSGGPTVIGGGDPMYPGNPNRTCDLAGVTMCASTNVDLLAHDVYNYYAYWAGHAPTYHIGTWKTLTYKLFDASDGMIPLAKRLGKKLLIAEMGSHPGCLSGDTLEGCNQSGLTLSNETRTDWFSDGILAIERSNDALNYLLGWSYFHKNDDWDWRFNTAGISPALDAFHQRGFGTTNSTVADQYGTGWGMVTNSAMFKSTPISL